MCYILKERVFLTNKEYDEEDIESIYLGKVGC